MAALLHGLPVVTTRGEYLDNRFVDGENMYLVPPGDSEKLADAFVELSSHPSLRERLAQGAKALYHAHFSWDAIASQVADVALGQVQL